MSADIFDARSCALGEGPLWHPLRKQLFWFDILGRKLLSQQDGHSLEWEFEEHVSAASWIDEDALLIASQTGLWRFDLQTGTRSLVVALEADQPLTRSNDGRADPWGGFWIGTMGLNAERDAGSIYRYYNGELRQLFAGLTITNSIAFSPDRRLAYFTDTVVRRIMKVELAPDTGAPAAEAQVFVDLSKEELNPDGSVVDAMGYLWNAQWGAGRIARYAPDGSLHSVHEIPASQVTCPSFGGDGLRNLFVTSAAIGLGSVDAHDGKTFRLPVDVQGQAEHRVIL